jgi:hypothetical protein
MRITSNLLPSKPGARLPTKNVEEPLQMEVDALGKKVSENTHNAIHDLDALNSAVRRHAKNWQDQTAKLYGRILVFSILGAFAGTMAALLVVRFVH